MKYNVDEVKKFLEDFNRMCENSNCGSCEMTTRKLAYSCSNAVKKLPLQTIEIVSNWCEEHPKKTYKTDYFEKFPNNRYAKDAFPSVCCGMLYGFTCKLGTICEECWNREME